MVDLAHIFSKNKFLQAVTSQGKTLTYGELIEAVNQARVFISRNPQPSRRIALKFENRMWFDICFLAAIQQGHCVVPISKRWAEGRQEQILKEAQVSQILSDSWIPEILKCAPDAFKAKNNSNLDSLFALMNTSGSTGISKMVGVTYGNFQALMSSLLPIYPMDPGEKVAQTFEPVFDPYFAISLLGYWQGAHLVHLEASDVFRVFDFCHDHQIEFWASVPSLVDISLKRGTPKNASTSLKRSLFTGEKLRAALATHWSQWAPASSIENLYGPVEACVWVTRALLDKSGLHDPLPIGEAFPSAKLSLVDGEILIEGPQVAKGYFRGEKCLNFSRQYRTGDLAVVDPAGRWTWLGRSDSQIKVAGQRVNLDELEAVVAQKLGHVCLLLWSEFSMSFTAVTETPINEPEIIEALKTELPVTHIPKKWLVVESLPRNTNGKWDRKKAAETWGAV
jgi:non-ribosomal peptide synthetase component F